MSYGWAVREGPSPESDEAVAAVCQPCGEGSGVMDAAVAITGAASGLGRVIARTLLEHGHPVVILDRDDEEARRTAGEFEMRHGVHVPVVVADLATIEGIDAAADQLISRFTVGGLINNAGGWLSGEQLPEADRDSWLASITLNLLAPMLLTHRLWATLSATSGAVVNVGSSGGHGDEPYGSPEYGAAKAGIRRFSSSLGSRSDVRVMAVVPGWIGLDRAHREWAALSAEQQQDVGPLIPPEDVAATILRLLEHGRAGEVVELLHG